MKRERMRSNSGTNQRNESEMAQRDVWLDASRSARRQIAGAECGEDQGHGHDQHHPGIDEGHLDVEIRPHDGAAGAADEQSDRQPFDDRPAPVA
jgi:hypothetical protein